MIKVKNLNLEGVCVLDIPIHKDNRGYMCFFNFLIKKKLILMI